MDKAARVDSGKKEKLASSCIVENNGREKGETTGIVFKHLQNAFVKKAR